MEGAAVGMRGAWTQRVQVHTCVHAHMSCGGKGWIVPAWRVQGEGCTCVHVCYWQGGGCVFYLVRVHTCPWCVAGLVQ